MQSHPNILNIRFANNCFKQFINDMLGVYYIQMLFKLFFTALGSDLIDSIGKTYSCIYKKKNLREENVKEKDTAKRSCN